MIQRNIEETIKSQIKPGRVFALLGARRTGKTTLMKSIIESKSNLNNLVLNGEDFDVAQILSIPKQENLKNLVSGYQMLFIDEAQNIPNIGQTLKLLIDTVPNISVFVTGSASFDLRNKLGEPLTGRSRTMVLYPFSFFEINTDYIAGQRILPELLIYGTYPQVFTEDQTNEKRLLLEDIRNAYLLKDILVLDNLKNSQFVMNILRLLAYQIGQDISYNEIARNLQTTVKTVKRYIELLEKAFVIFRLEGYSKNLRKEISKSPRFYFWDNGIRNAVISNFSPIELRNDIGALWENFCISERIKLQSYAQKSCNFYFWRTYDQQEIDLVEIENEQCRAFEFKWGNKKAKIPKAFKDNYPEASFSVINQESFYNFLKP